MGWQMTRAEKREEKRLTGIYAASIFTPKKKYRPNHRAKLRKWRKLVLQRDDYTCQYCGMAESLHAHHKKSKADCPALRYKVKNGITLCEHCHDRAHQGLISYYKQQSFLRSIVRPNLRIG